MKRYIWRISLIYLFFLSLSSSVFGQTQDKFLIIGLEEYEAVFNPVYAHTSTDMMILNGIYEGLVTYHPLTLETLPGQAYQWDISSDKTVYTFYIREDARYSDGTPVLAEDFYQSFLQNLNPRTGSDYAVYLDVIKGARAFREGKITDPKNVGLKVLPGNKLQFSLEKPASHFLKVLCLINFSPLHPSYRNLKNWENKLPLITNGPFVLTSYTNKEMIMLKNKYYWDNKQVKLDGIKFLFYEDEAALSRDFNAGKIHWTDLRNCLYSELDALAKGKIIANAMFATSFLFFNCQKKPFADPRVRKALALLLPWNIIRSRQYSIYPTSRLVPEIPKYPQVKGIEKQDVQKALALLEEAGYPKGSGLPAIVFLTVKGSNYYFEIFKKAITEHLQAQVIQKEVSGSDYLKYLGKHEYTIASLVWIGDFADPMAFLQMWTSESNLNEALYKSKAYDKLIDEALYLSGIERYQKLAEAESMLLEEAVVLPIDHIAAFNVLDKEIIGGWYPNPLDHHPFKYIEIKQEKINKWIVRTKLFEFSQCQNTF